MGGHNVLTPNELLDIDLRIQRDPGSVLAQDASRLLDEVRKLQTTYFQEEKLITDLLSRLRRISELAYVDKDD